MRKLRQRLLDDDVSGRGETVADRHDGRLCDLIAPGNARAGDDDGSPSSG
ncbi:MAG TPA: hypothetical protein VIR62_12265 [Allosphingosinicella sp.]